MKKRIIVCIVFVMMTVLCLSACGSTVPVGSGQTEASFPSKEKNVGKFVVNVPTGWTAFEQRNVFEKKDDSGQYPIDENAILIGKGQVEEWEAASGPNIRISYYENEDEIYDSKQFYDNVEDLFDVVINGVECPAFSGDLLGFTYQCVRYPTNNGTFEISILTQIDGKETGVKWDDEDVLTALSSLHAVS